jgi:nucleotide-binding universal stress UspA family protein
MKRILVPCNFSTHSERALKFAIEIASKSEGSVHVCTVLSDPTTAQNHSGSQLTPAQAEEKYPEFISLFDTTGVTVVHHIIIGKITPALLEFIEAKKIDLVVMGTSGSRGWSEAFMGSNIGKIVRTSPIPVFAVKGNTAVKQIRNIVFPCSMKSEEAHLIPEIKRLQTLFGARIHLLFVNTNPRRDNQAGLQKLKDYAELHGLRQFNVNVTHNAIEKDGIIQFTREINADMIAMATHGNRNPGNMYVSSIAADIANYANVLTWTCATDTAITIQENENVF